MRVTPVERDDLYTPETRKDLDAEVGPLDFGPRVQENAAISILSPLTAECAETFPLPANFKGTT